MSEVSNFNRLRAINVSQHVEKKGGLSYLSWAWAWDIFKQHCPDASYRVVKHDDGLLYKETPAGVMCLTEVTAGGETHEMWLPVMDSRNRALLPGNYSMFDVNKTIMRCLVKNLAMFGLGLYIYAGEDLPEDPQAEPINIDGLLESIRTAASIEDLKTAYVAAVKSAKGDQAALKQLEAAKDERKAALAGAEK